MQQQNALFSHFLHRTDALAKSLGVNVQDLPAIMDVSRRTLFAGRSEESSITAKTWRKLEAAEQKAGIINGPDSLPVTQMSEEDGRKILANPFYNASAPRLAKMWREKAQTMRAMAEEFEGIADKMDPPPQPHTPDAHDPPGKIIPFFERIAAGFPVDVSNPSWQEIKVDSVKFPQVTFALRVSGDSMIGAGINDGDIVAMAVREPRSGEIVAALVDNESTLKKFISGEQPRLRAENPLYKDIIPGQELVIQGVMIGKIE